MAEMANFYIETQKQFRKPTHSDLTGNVVMPHN
jgi:hypothetical protein